ncbi:MAG TPA: hypothetical protein VN903_20070 [Polyangia bacterium]|nr:hypothetical protein [Polyangia bacterium]
MRGAEDALQDPRRPIETEAAQAARAYSLENDEHLELALRLIGKFS